MAFMMQEFLRKKTFLGTNPPPFFFIIPSLNKVWPYFHSFGIQYFGVNVGPVGMEKNWKCYVYKQMKAEQVVIRKASSSVLKAHVS